MTHKRHIECEECHKAKPDVMLRLDPYVADIEGIEEKRLLCDDCTELRANGI